MNQRFFCAWKLRDDGNMSFEDFLDMVSAFSEHSPTDYKALWAFKIYGKTKGLSYVKKWIKILCSLKYYFQDFDRDQNINSGDIRILIQKLVGTQDGIDDDIEVFTKKVRPAFIISNVKTNKKSSMFLHRFCQRPILNPRG